MQHEATFVAIFVTIQQLWKKRFEELQ